MARAYLGAGSCPRSYGFGFGGVVPPAGFFSRFCALDVARAVPRAELVGVARVFVVHDGVEPVNFLAGVDARKMPGRALSAKRQLALHAEGVSLSLTEKIADTRPP